MWLMDRFFQNERRARIYNALVAGSEKRRMNSDISRNSNITKDDEYWMKSALGLGIKVRYSRKSYISIK